MKNLQLFSFSESEYLGLEVAKALNTKLAMLEERIFEDREFKVRPLEAVLGKDVYVIQSMFSAPYLSPQDKLCRLIFLIGALKDAGASQVTAITPYLCYARKDRRTKEFDPLSLRYIATMMEAVGLDRIVTLEVHNQQAYENAFRIPTSHLSAAHLFVSWLEFLSQNQDIAIVSPDVGGVKRVDALRHIVEQKIQKSVGLGIVEKYRSMGKVSGNMFVGDIQNKVVLIYDDILSSGTTLLRAARICQEHGASEVHLAVTHGIFIGDVWREFEGSGVKTILITDSVKPLSTLPSSLPVQILPTAGILAEEIIRLHRFAV
ncbi:MAG: ribose-phosphate diphosphokinase [Oligoflexus sp.]